MKKRTQQTAHLPTLHLGIFRRKLSLWQAVALIVSGTVGAGVLGLPYAVAQVGMAPGLLMIMLLGLAMMGINLLLGSVCSRTRRPLQLVGLAKEYLGSWGARLMMAVFYVSMLAVLLIYIIGVGETLTALLGGAPIFWSTVFFLSATALIFIGIRTIKTVELILTGVILAIICAVAIFSAPHASFSTWQFAQWSSIFAPYGVILFAFHAAFAIPEAHQLLLNKERDFRLAIAISSLATVVMYALFAIAVVSVTGVETTQIATIGLGERVGTFMVFFGNLFAIVAMGTSYLLVGLSMKHSLCWDFKIPGWLAGLIISVIPYTTFLLGVDSFIQTIGIVGGVLVSTELILTLLIFLRARRVSGSQQGIFRIPHAVLLAGFLLAVCIFGAISSIMQI